MNNHFHTWIGTSESSRP